ncbi:hypothetical protein HPG69_005781 [Diceros bicornis minor]|uniref:Uncharacterized protein n=1 Tax=Diceros bicornis minor TaxID=77932 RepID=A0A7J7ESS9_DICBM|nr:hypothetical protein HPG69_005781 [Diceros bicornis minor]
MARIVERLGEINWKPQEEQNRDLCVRHEEKLLLFCRRLGRSFAGFGEGSGALKSTHTPHGEGFPGISGEVPYSSGEAEGGLAGN